MKKNIILTVLLLATVSQIIGCQQHQPAETDSQTSELVTEVEEESVSEIVTEPETEKELVPMPDVLNNGREDVIQKLTDYHPDYDTSNVAMLLPLEEYLKNAFVWMTFKEMVDIYGLPYDRWTGMSTLTHYAYYCTEDERIVLVKYFEMYDGIHAVIYGYGSYNDVEPEEGWHRFWYNKALSMGCEKVRIMPYHPIEHFKALELGTSFKDIIDQFGEMQSASNDVITYYTQEKTIVFIELDQIIDPETQTEDVIVTRILIQENTQAQYLDKIRPETND